MKGIESLFHPCVNTVVWRPYWWLYMEVSNCTSGFGAVIRHDLPAFSLACELLRNNQYAHVM